MKNNLAKASTCYFIGNLFDKAMAFITVPIFTRLLTSREYGLISTYLSWASILTIILTLSVGNSIRTAIYDFQDDINGYISSIFSLSIVSSLGISSLLIIIASFATKSVSLIVAISICLYSFSNSILSAIQLKYMMEVRYVKRTLLQCIPNVIIVVLSIILIYLLQHDKYMGRLYAYAIVSFVIASIYIIAYYKKGKTFYNNKYWRYAFAFSLPLVFHSLSNVILSQADRTMLTLLVDASETGVYSIAYQFGMIPLVITTTMENVWIPWFTEKLNASNKKTVNQVAKQYILVVVILCIGIMLVAPEVLKLMTTSEYYAGVYTVPPVILATFFMFLASISIDLEYYLKKTKIIASNTVIAAALNILLNLIFIPLYGSVAAGYTTVVSYVVSFIVHYTYTSKVEPNLFEFKIYILPIILMIIATFITSALMKYIIFRWGIAILLLVAFGGFSYKNYKDIILQVFKRR